MSKKYLKDISYLERSTTSTSDKSSNGDQGLGNKDASVSGKDDTAVKTGDPLNAERPVLLFVISAMLLLAAWELKKHKDNI